MPLDSTTRALLKPKYGKFPGPNSATYDKGVKTSNLLTLNGVNTPGAIAIGLSTSGWLYIGFSPSLQKKLLDKKNKINFIPWLAQASKAGLKAKKVWICTDVEKQIAKSSINPGCAEKKVITSIRKFGDSLADISIVQHPVDGDNQILSAYEAVGDRFGMYIVPCDCCLKIATTYL